MQNNRKWPKVFPPLSSEQCEISDDFMKHWHEILASGKRYTLIENFNHEYAVKNAPQDFLRTLEIGAGLGEHLSYEKLSDEQKKNYTTLELRENMSAQLKKKYPEIQALVGDCQQTLPFSDGYFDRILAVHVLEHLPNLPMAIKEMHRLCNKDKGIFSIVIPCEGGVFYTLARKLSAQRIFEKRYKQSYQWFIEREHVNRVSEIFEELAPYFQIIQKSYFPFLLPVTNMNLCIGITLRPK